ncbi:Probable glycosidase C21B10.07 [Durusdinium trenchii]|uniref:Probable glycosidase C21B10.07 n=1 Tax=Durusdinium trenchii TaxID=1381693 RepID=A0ABP0M5C5_9DINO
MGVARQDDTHGAQKYLSKSEAFRKNARSSSVISVSSKGSAVLRVGELIPTGDAGAPYKRNSVMIHSNYAWTPSAGMLVVMKYNHVPYGPSIWPALWLMNSDNVWPKGGEFDIMEYANDEASKITFHAERNCFLDNRKLENCMRGKHMGGPGPSNCNTNYWKNLLGCRPRQIQRTGSWYAKNPGVIAAAWDNDGITVYHIPEHRIPADLKDDRPKPENWGEFAVAYLPMEHHSCKDIAQPQEIVLNIALCGDWAGNGWFRSGEARRTGYTHGCGPLIFEPNRDCCTHFATSKAA